MRKPPVENQISGYGHRNPHREIDWSVQTLVDGEIGDKREVYKLSHYRALHAEGRCEEHSRDESAAASCGPDRIAESYRPRVFIWNHSVKHTKAEASTKQIQPRSCRGHRRSFRRASLLTFSQLLIIAPQRYIRGLLTERVQWYASGESISSFLKRWSSLLSVGMGLSGRSSSIWPQGRG